MPHHQQRVVIFTDFPGWHGKRLTKAFAKRHITSQYLSLNDCYFDLNSATGLQIPTFTDCLPDGVFVRGIAGGTFEQVTVRLGILHALKAAGVPIYNDVRAIERTVDKSMTSFLLYRAGIPTPATVVCESREQASHVLHTAFARGEEMVLKPLFGSQGKRLLRLKAGDSLPAGELYNHLYYLQTFIPCANTDKSGNTLAYHDWRVFVINGKAQAAMLRHSQHWITNRAQGASCRASALDPELIKLAESAAQTINVDYAGVDILRDKAGQAYVLEVNGVPAWQGLQGVCKQDIADCLVDDFVLRYLSPYSQAHAVL
ncbi:ATP-grasp domain-containing protein [Beggiatoa leptomitoformis]|uniref:ATP-grasp domain-containing protein n=1 Tax=Beggiatoa leptomitoformis TaxID=288004 RepID=A0A2N9YHG5_9GAMM|nr:ATP-grasp domain-containing protein [Beggiatoa leptomitoformis]ALG67782.1 ATP-grasp domain-containing protein [Beggiatoa leptomitoformis]AUI69972.1 ATP-grasp domain-containing protein [Beggiatoa leptomitoformis]